MIKNCEFIKLENSEKYICKYKGCGRIVPTPNVKANCKSSLEQISNESNDIKPPPLLNRIVNFIAAASKHAIAGNPVVSEEVLNKRLEICKNCPSKLFKPNTNTVGGVCTHQSCGCNIQDNVTYLNKIAWADQECPEGHWHKENGV